MQDSLTPSSDSHPSIAHQATAHPAVTHPTTGKFSPQPAAMPAPVSRTPNTHTPSARTSNQRTSGAHRRFVMYILSFLFALHYSLPAYITSSFLAGYTGDALVGSVYILASILAILVFFSMPHSLRRWGNYRVIMTLLIIEIISLLGLAVSQFLPNQQLAQASQFIQAITHTTAGLASLAAVIVPVTSFFAQINPLYLIMPFFLASFVAIALINFNMDIFLENLSSSEKMGESRGFFLTSSNAAWVVAALLTSFILTGNDYWKIFIAAAILILPVLFLLSNNLRDFKDPVYIELPVWSTLREIWANKNIWCAFMVNFLLQFFYAWMTVYTPIYLHQVIGFDWMHIGGMFAIMLLPFVLTELPLGKLADSRWGEKEVMSVGFIVLAISTGLISFIQSGPATGAVNGTGPGWEAFWLWATILFISRIGASMVEVMSETYFFKKVNGSTANLISFFRTLRPISYILSPALAMILFLIPGFQFRYIFVILAIIMFFGLRYSLSLEDTR
jgi:MFS family permease